MNTPQEHPHANNHHHLALIVAVTVGGLIGLWMATTYDTNIPAAIVVGALIGAMWDGGWAIETIIPFVVCVGAVCGLVNGLLVTRLGLPSLAVTIGTLALYRGLAYVVLGDKAVAVDAQLSGHARVSIRLRAITMRCTSEGPS